jgi:transcription antitermination factor NusG
MHAEGGPLWYALYVRTRFEKVVAQNLRGKGFEEFLPLYSHTSQGSDYLRQIELPLFHRYVFCRFNAFDRLAILTIPLVNAIVGFGADFIPVDEDELNANRGVLRTGTHCEP